MTISRVMAALTLASAVALAANAASHGDHAGHGASHSPAHKPPKTEHHDGKATGHAHTRLMDLAPSRAPQMDIRLTGTPGEGQSVQLTTTNIRFSKAHADGPHVPGEGHAHLYIDGKKIGRIYVHETRLEPLAPGVHEIRIGLFTNDHAAYAAGGVPVSQRYVVKVDPRAKRHAEGAMHRFEMAVADVKISDNTVRVKQGDVVELVWTGDARVGLHLHGYDIEAEIVPGSRTVMRFVASVAGRFPVALHGQGGGGHGHRALAYLDVYPR